MLVPQYWAEARVQHRQPGRQITIRRFGWSDTSQADAQVIADARAADALERLLSGESVARREPKVPYNGAIGVPIREEIVSRHGETVITRNSYGARCLNSPNALFADIDFSPGPPFYLGFLLAILISGAAFWVGWRAGYSILGGVVAIGALVITRHIAKRAYRAKEEHEGGPDGIARTRIARFASTHLDWNLRIYRTPAGLRVLVTHQPFSPSDPAVQEFFQAIGADPLYVRMCLNQQCFRARVSPKPWRMGIEEHMKPRPGVWPVHPDRLPLRQKWIADYEDAARSFAACEFIDSIGSGTVHPEIVQVQQLHDTMCQSTSGLPIA